ncbi:MAG: hypothetical protein ABIH21_01095, partial [Patescibacteria group bacterium]
LVDNRALGNIPFFCKLLGVHVDQTLQFEDFEPVARPDVYWMICHDGRFNDGISAHECRYKFLKLGDRVGLNAVEGLCLYAHFRRVVYGHRVELPGSVIVDPRGQGNRDSVACLYLNASIPVLGQSGADSSVKGFGSAARARMDFDKPLAA